MSPACLPHGRHTGHSHTRQRNTCWSEVAPCRLSHFIMTWTPKPKPNPMAKPPVMQQLALSANDQSVMLSTSPKGRNATTQLLGTRLFAHGQDGHDGHLSIRHATAERLPGQLLSSNTAHRKKEKKRLCFSAIITGAS